MLRCLLGLLLVWAAAAQDVVELTEHTFDAWIQEHPVALVQFHTPWCSKCKEFAPDWSKLAAKAKGLDVPLATVDAKEYKELADRFNVYGYPNIQTFHDGENEDYDGKRDFDAIWGHIERIASYKPPRQLSAAELEQMAAASAHRVILGLFRQPVGASAAFKTFKSTLWELARSGHPISAGYSASYGAPPVLPLKPDGKAPPVPSLVQLDSKGVGAAKIMPLPRKKDEFNSEAIVAWLQSAGMEAKIEEKPNDYPEKDYSDPDEVPEYNSDDSPEYDDD